MVVFFSAFVYMVYYLGIMGVVIKKIGWLLQAAMGTSAAESLNAAGNIFIGQVRYQMEYWMSHKNAKCLMSH